MVWLQGLAPCLDLRSEVRNALGIAFIPDEGPKGFWFVRELKFDEAMVRSIFDGAIFGKGGD